MMIKYLYSKTLLVTFIYTGSIDNVCVPTGLETPVKLFSYPSYGAPNIGKFVEWLFGFLLLV